MSRTETRYWYTHLTNAGLVGLVPEVGGRYKVMFGEENLGSYPSAVAAASDVAGGHTSMPSNGIDLGQLNIPDDLSAWKKRVFMEIDKLRPT